MVQYDLIDHESGCCYDLLMTSCGLSTYVAISCEICLCSEEQGNVCALGFKGVRQSLAVRYRTSTLFRGSTVAVVHVGYVRVCMESVTSLVLIDQRPRVLFTVDPFSGIRSAAASSMPFMRYPLSAVKPPLDMFKSVDAVSDIMYGHGSSSLAEAAGAILVRFDVLHACRDHVLLMLLVLQLDLSEFDLPSMPALAPADVMRTDRLRVKPLLDGISLVQSVLRTNSVSMTVETFLKHDRQIKFTTPAAYSDPLAFHEEFQSFFASQMKSGRGYLYDYSFSEGSLYEAGQSVNFDDVPCIVRDGLPKQLIICDGEAVGVPGFPGVTTCYNYHGIRGSLFALHDEDLFMPSLNVLIGGSPKIWYLVPQAYHDRVLDLLKVDVRGCDQYPGNDCMAIQMHKDLFLSPSWFDQHSIPVHVLAQKPGQAVLLYPRVLHQGFNSGENFAVATNLTVPEWLPHAVHAKVVS